MVMKNYQFYLDSDQIEKVREKGSRQYRTLTAEVRYMVDEWVKDVTPSGDEAPPAAPPATKHHRGHGADWDADAALKSLMAPPQERLVGRMPGCVLDDPRAGDPRWVMDHADEFECPLLDPHSHDSR